MSVVYFLLKTILTIQDHSSFFNLYPQSAWVVEQPELLHKVSRPLLELYRHCMLKQLQLSTKCRLKVALTVAKASITSTGEKQLAQNAAPPIMDISLLRRQRSVVLVKERARQVIQRRTAIRVRELAKSSQNVTNPAASMAGLHMSVRIPFTSSTGLRGFKLQLNPKSEALVQTFLHLRRSNLAVSMAKALHLL